MKSCFTLPLHIPHSPEREEAEPPEHDVSDTDPSALAQAGGLRRAGVHRCSQRDSQVRCPHRAPASQTLYVSEPASVRLSLADQSGHEHLQQ